MSIVSRLRFSVADGWRRLRDFIVPPHVFALQCGQCGEIWPENILFSPGKPIETRTRGRQGQPPQCLMCNGRVLIKVRVRRSLVHEIEASP